MRYSQIEEALLSAISDNDPNKVSKQLQIKQWTDLYGLKLLRSSPPNELDFIVQVISSEDCWYEVDNLDRIKLNRYEVGRKLLASKTPNGEDNPFDKMQKYQVACLCCFEDKIRELWAEAQSNLRYNIPIVMQLDSTYSGYGALVTHWTHYITGHMDKLKDEFGLTGDNNDLHGFKNAVVAKHSEALEYFWDKLQPILSQEEKDDLLIHAATYDEAFIGMANSDIIAFVMDHLDKIKYHELLEKDFKHNKHYSTISTLKRSYLFDRAEELFKYLTPEDMTEGEYDTSMYAALSSIVSVPMSQDLIDAGYQMLATMWHMDGFDEHRQFFMNRLSYGASGGDEIAQLVKVGRTSDILSEIVSALNVEQVKNFQKSESWAYEIFKSANLFNDDVMKQLEETGVNTLDKQEDTPILGDSASIDNQELDSM